MIETGPAPVSLETLRRDFWTSGVSKVYIEVLLYSFGRRRSCFISSSVVRRENATYEANHVEQTMSIRDALSAARTAHEEAHRAAEARKEERAQTIRISDIEERAVLRLPFNDKTKELQELSELQEQVVLLSRFPADLSSVHCIHVRVNGNMSLTHFCGN